MDSLTLFNNEKQLYDRSAERYTEIPYEETAEIYGEIIEEFSALKECLQKANRHLYKIDELAEKKFKDKMKTSEFDRMRRALDKCAERLQWSTERAREMSYFLRIMLEDST